MEDKAFFKIPFTRWCTEATHLIKFGPDREAVSSELYDHISDHFDDLVAQGMTEEEAREKALEAMGSAEEIAPQLADLHRPFWGYFLRVSRIVLIILLCLSIIPVWNYYSELRFYDTSHFWNFPIYDSASYGGDTGRTLLHLSRHDLSFRTDGSTFTLTDAALITTTQKDGTVGNPTLYIRMRQRSMLPCTEQEGLFSHFSITGWFFARDSLGNIYEGCMDRSDAEGRCMNTTDVQSGIFTRTHECWINDFPAEAQWVEICYDRDGRSFALRVYLTGGDCT